MRLTSPGTLSRRRYASLWIACLILAPVLSACVTASLASSPQPVSPTVIPRPALWTNTFPPIQDNGAMLRFSHYGLEQGLSQSSVQAIIQDDQGFLWVGTQDGLNRFDGYSFTVFRSDPNALHSLSSSEILCMIPGADGVVWIGTNDGLNRYDPVTGKFTHWLHDDADPDSLVNNVVQALYQDAQGVLWVGTHTGLDTFDSKTGKFRHFYLLDKPAGSGKVDSINALYEDADRTLWIGTNDGLVRLGIEGGRFQRYQNDSGERRGISFNQVCCIVQDQAGQLWIGTHQGVDRLNPSNDAITIFVHSDQDAGSLADDYIQSLYLDRAQQLWIGTRNGLDRFNAQSQRFVHSQKDPTDPDSLNSNSVVSIYEDRGGILWIGTADGGLNQHDRSQDRFAYYHHVNTDPDSLSGNVIFPILPAPGGKMWIGTSDGGLNLFGSANGRSQHFRHDPSNPDSLLNDAVISLFLDKDKTLWVGTHRGLDRLYPASVRFTHYVNDPLNSESLPFGTVFKIFQDYQSTYWIGTAQGLRIFDPLSGAFTRLNASGADPAGLADGPVLTIFQDRAGILWFGTDSHGLFRFNPTTRQLEQYLNAAGSTNSLSSNTVLDINEDHNGTIWVATFGGGLNRYIPERNDFQQYRQGQGLPNDVVYGVLEDQDGNLWLSTNAGISRFDPSTGAIQNFTVKDGLQSNEFNSSSFAKDEHGRMYFGGVNGLTVFDPRDVQKNSYVPPLVITALTTQDGKPLAPAQSAETLHEVTLSYPQNSFDLSFAALSFSNSTSNQYKYMLQGFDRNWHVAGSDHRGSYTNLPGGTYMLRIIGNNSDGVWNEVGTELKVTVIPPFWQTWTFRAFSGVVLVLAALFAYRSRVRGIQAQKSELEHIVVDRTQALQKQNLDLEALYSADEKMLRVLSQDQVLQVLVDVAVDVLKADKSAVFIQEAGNADYSVQVSRGFRPETVTSPAFSSSQQSLLTKAADAEALIITDTQVDLRGQHGSDDILALMSAENVRSLMYIPIKVQDILLGILNVCSSAPGAFNGDRPRLFGSLVQRAALSIENGRLFEQTRHMAILEERNRLAQELHDSAKQRAFAALAQLGAAKKLVNHHDGSAAEHLVEAENIVSEVIHDLTHFIKQSYPGALKEKGLAPSLREYAFSWESRFGIPLSVTVAGERRLPLRVEQALYRVVQEALSNIARHSQATRAGLYIGYQPHEIEIRIGDNGKGFDVAGTDEGLGLQLIHERLESLGGRVKLQSRREGGTLITVCVPIPPKE